MRILGATLLGEILHTVKSNRLRTCLTSFSIAWGIFMLTILLGVGTGFENSMKQKFTHTAINSIMVRPGQTQLPFRGLAPGRPIRFSNADVRHISETEKYIDHLSAYLFLPQHYSVSRRGVSGRFRVIASHPDNRYIHHNQLRQGRFINDLDYAQSRKVVVIGARVKFRLFEREPAIGSNILVNQVPFKVVGIFTNPAKPRREEVIYLPISTAQQVFNQQEALDTITFTTAGLSAAANNRVVMSLTKLLANRHRFDPMDRGALNMSNTVAVYTKTMRLFENINLFIWVIGVGTLMAGVLGVSNIMVIGVKERTREIGIRKALGATPGHILKLVFTEAMVLTSVSGYLGLVLGVAVIALANRFLPPTDFFVNPEIDIRIGLAALSVLIFAGICAGVVPARKAAGIRPVAALNDGQSGGI